MSLDPLAMVEPLNLLITPKSGGSYLATREFETLNKQIDSRFYKEQRIAPHLMEIQQEEEIIFMDDRPLSYKLAAPEGIDLHVGSQDDNLFGAQHEENAADVTGYFKLVEDQEEEQDD